MRFTGKNAMENKKKIDEMMAQKEKDILLCNEG